MRKLLILLLLCLFVTPIGGQFIPSQQKPMFGTQINWTRTHGLVGFWLMNEGSGNIIRDFSGSRRDTTQTGNPIWIPGRYGITRQYDGDDKDVIATENVPIATTEVTAIVCFRQTSSGGFDSPFARWQSVTGNRTQWCFYIESGDSNKIKFFVGDGSTFPEATGPAITLNRDYCVAGVYKKDNGAGDGIKIYVDGVLVDTQAGNITMSDSSLNVDIGNLQSNTVSWALVGNVEFAMLFNRALSASEIQQIYREPFGMFVPSFNWFLYGGIAVPTAGGYIIFVDFN